MTRQLNADILSCTGYTIEQNKSRERVNEDILKSKLVTLEPKRINNSKLLTTDLLLLSHYYPRVTLCCRGARKGKRAGGRGQGGGLNARWIPHRAIFDFFHHTGLSASQGCLALLNMNGPFAK